MSKKILFLHGYAQSAQIFSGKTGGLRKALVKQGYDTVYLNGPIKLNQENAGHEISNDSELYGWWKFGDDNFDESELFEIIKSQCDINEIEGLIGFSQGGGLSGILTSFLPNLKFSVIFSGFKLKNEKFDKYYKEINIPILNVIGELDTVVEESRSLNLYKVCNEDSLLLKHQGGHFVPNSKDFVNKVISWIVNMEKEEAQEEEDLESLMNAIDNLGKA